MSCLIIASPVWSQSQPLRFANFSIEAGLSNATVTAIAQDKEGFLWFGTEDGLNKYDGYTVTVFKHRPDDSSSISWSSIGALCLDSSGNLWIVTNAGLDRYNKQTGGFVHVSNEIAGMLHMNTVSIDRISFDQYGKLWIATAGGRVYSIDFASRVAVDVTAKFSLLDGSGIVGINVLYVDRSGRVWIGSSEGISLISSDRKRIVRFGGGAGGALRDLAGGVTAIAEDIQGKIWIGTFGSGVYLFDELQSKPVRVHISDDKHRQAILSLMSDAKGLLWIGLFNEGMVVFDPVRHSSELYHNNTHVPASIASDRIYRIFQDQSGSVWFGTWKGGVSAYHPYASKFQHIAHAWYDSTTLSDNTVWSICEDRGGTLWVGTDQGLNRYDKKLQRFHGYTYSALDPHSLSSNTIKSVCSDSTGTLWIGTAEGGLNRYDRTGDRFVRYHHDPTNPRSLGSDVINALYVDRGGDLWIGGNSLDRYDRSTDRFIHLDSVLTAAPLFRSLPRSATAIQSIVEDHAGQLWISMFPLGLFRLDKRTKALASYSQPAASYYLHLDPAGTVWLGSFGQGLCRYNASTDSFEYFTELDGLPSNFVKGILSDDRGNLWLSTSKGLSRFNPALHTVHNYDLSNGIQSYEFRTASCFKGRAGKLYFGGANGFNAFYPDSLHDNPAVPPVAITAFRVLGKPFSLPGAGALQSDLQLSHQENVFEFEFVGLNFTAPQKNRYAYMLEGLDKNWIFSDTRRYVSYAHLDAGDYIFRVKASNNDGVWNEAGASMHLIIHPPFWKTWWFIGLTLLAATLLMYAIYRYRLSKLLEIERTRSAIAIDLHDDIGTSLTNIALFSDLAQRDVTLGSPEVAHRLEKISQTSRSLLDSMNDIVWSIKPENDALEQTMLRMEDYAVEILEENGIDLHVRIPDHLKALKLPMAVRRNLFLIFKEAIGNVLKHAHATNVAIAIASVKSGKRSSDLEVSIVDNGKGFNPQGTKSGNGLQNMELRTRNLNGTFTVTSDGKQGTRVEIRFPIKSHK